jgi:hypothetical protein
LIYNFASGCAIAPDSGLPAGIYATEADAAREIASQIAGMKWMPGREYGAWIYSYIPKGASKPVFGITPITLGPLVGSDGSARWYPFRNYSVDGKSYTSATFADPLSGDVSRISSGKVGNVTFTANEHMHPEGSGLGFSGGDVDSGIAYRNNIYLLDMGTKRMFFIDISIYIRPGSADDYYAYNMMDDSDKPMFPRSKVQAELDSLR